jgi:hypothetical protein
MESFVFVAATTAATETFHVVLKFSLHYATDGDDISTDARVNQIVFDLTVNRLGHLACIYVFDIVINFL